MISPEQAKRIIDKLLELSGSDLRVVSVKRKEEVKPA